MKRAALLLTLFLATRADAADLPSRFHRIDPPQPAPPLIFEDSAGNQHALSDYRGRYVFLNIWALWCQPCIREMPSLDALQKNFSPQALTVLPIAESHDASDVEAFYRKRGLTHLPVAIDPTSSTPAALRAHGIPTSFLLDPQGREILRMDGTADWSAPDITDFLQNAIQPQPEKTKLNQ